MGYTLKTSIDLSQVKDLKRDEPKLGHRWTMRRVLVVGQLAVSVVLLLTAFLFLRNLARAPSTDSIPRQTWRASSAVLPLRE